MAHNPLIDRGLLVVVLDRLHHFPAAAILGPRQIGKTTLARMVAERVGRPVLWLDLERPSDRALLTDPYAYLPQHADKLVVIDEVQRMPEVFQALRVLIDERRRPGRFLLLGSSSPEIVRRAAESLAGRIAYMDLYPLNMLEVGMDHAHDLWLRGGYPDAFLAPSNGQAAHVQLAILRSLVERELPQLGLPAAPEVTFTLLRMLASVHGQPLNMSMLARSMGLTVTTVRTYIEFFAQAYIVFRLYSHRTNTRKRITKAPKLYITDSGLLHALLNITELDQLRATALLGLSWEGFVVQQVRAWVGGRAELHYFRTQDGAELDLVITQGTRPMAAIEIKTTDAPTLSRGNRFAFDAVGAPVALICTPTAQDHAHGGGVQVCSLGTLWAHLDQALR